MNSTMPMYDFVSAETITWGLKYGFIRVYLRILLLTDIWNKYQSILAMFS